MTLSSSLIKSFAKITTTRASIYNRTAKSAYGTIAVDGDRKYVRIDGSDVSTPISIASDVRDKDRVIVQIQNHTATVVQNLTAPASGRTASETDKNLRNLELNSLTAASADIRYASITNLNATNEVVKNIQGDNAEFKNLTSEKFSAQDAVIEELRGKSATLDQATIDQLTANIVNATKVDVEKLLADYATIDSLNTTKASITELLAKYATVDSLEAAVGNVKTLFSGYATIGALDAATAQFSSLFADYATIDLLNTTKASITELLANYATVDLLNVKEGSITRALIGDGVVGTAQIADGSITDAKIVALTANKITAGTLSVERLEIRGSESSLVYALNNITGALQAQNVNTINGEVLTERTITADKIVANSITGNEIAANTIKANNIDVQDLFAQTVTATNLTVSGNSKIAGFSIDENSLYSDYTTISSFRESFNGGYIVLRSNSPYPGELRLTGSTIETLTDNYGSSFGIGTSIDYSKNISSSTLTLGKINPADVAYGNETTVSLDGYEGRIAGQDLYIATHVRNRYTRVGDYSIEVSPPHIMFSIVTESNGVDVHSKISGEWAQYTQDNTTYSYIYLNKIDGTGTLTQTVSLNGATGEVKSTTVKATDKFIGAIADSNNSSKTTFAYSKTGLGTDTKWLAAWNGYELRAISSDNVRQAMSAMGVKTDGTYWGMIDPGGNDSVWIRTTSKGIIPYKAGTSGSGHGYLGTDTWYFAYAYIDNVYGRFHGTADTLASNAGSAAQPIYFSGGKPVACSYSLNKSVPSDAKFTDTNTWRGIQNNLTSTATDQSLSAAQGKALNDAKMPKSGGTFTGNVATTNVYPSSANNYNLGTTGNFYNTVVTHQIRLGGNAYNSYNSNIYSLWKDGGSHDMLIKDTGGLAIALGWIGSSTYKTVTILRGQSVRLGSASGTVITSDIRLKENFESLDALDQFYDSIEPCSFQMKLSGGNHRKHAGFKAQQVENALVNSGLTTNDFAGIVYSDYVYDKDSPEETALMKELGIKPGETIYSLNYSEFIALNTHQIQKLKKRVMKLEQLESTVENLQYQLNEAYMRIAELEKSVA